jgi:hypothetical protein
MGAWSVPEILLQYRETECVTQNAHLDFGFAFTIEGPSMQESQSEHHDYWDSFYASRASNTVPEAPSKFAEWTKAQLGSPQPIVEFGFGNARDSLWFAREGHDVLGFDFAETAVQQARGRADGQTLPATFHELDLYSEADLADAAKKIGDFTDSPVIYGRFLIHSLEHSGRHHLFDLAAQVLPSGGSMYLEFRTGQDDGEKHEFGDDHFRIYLDPAAVVSEIEERGGSITHSEAGHGFAVYKTEDPHVARIVATWTP